MPHTNGAPGDGPEQFYFNISTHEVEAGRQSPWTQLMGPFATREEAARALERAAARSEAWDDEDKRERER